MAAALDLAGGYGIFAPSGFERPSRTVTLTVRVGVSAPLSDRRG